jgi:hypothetical protein
MDNEIPEDDYAERKKQLEGNFTVKRPIARLDVGCLPTKKDYKKHKMTPRKMLEKINQYFGWCERNDEMPSISGLMIHMKMYSSGFYHFMKDERYRDMLEQTKLMIKNWAETDIYNTKGLCAGKISYAKNILGWTEKTENINTNINAELSVDQARARIEALAPKLLEVLKNQNLLNQLVKPDVQEAVLIEHKESSL